MNVRASKTALICGLYLLVLLVAHHAVAATFTGLGDGVHWDEPNNWDPAGVPISGTQILGNHDVVFRAGTFNGTISWTPTAS